MFTLFFIYLKTTVAGFEPTPPEEKWFQVTRLRPLGHTVFVFILSFLLMYFNNTNHTTLLSAKFTITLQYMVEQFPSLQVCFQLFSTLNWLYLLFISLCFLFFHSFIYFYFIFFSLFYFSFFSFYHLICSSYTLLL